MVHKPKFFYIILSTGILMLLCTAFTYFSCSDEDSNGALGKPKETKAPGFYVEDGKIYDTNGQEFIPLGPNAEVFWQANKKCHLQSLREHIPQAGANAVRLVTVTNNENWAWNSTAANKRAMIEASIEGEIVPMLEFHDATCDDDFEPVADYWNSEKIIQLCKEFEKYLIINLANEHNFETMEDWLERYSRLIQNLREEEVNNMIVVDGHSKCGQGPEVFTEYARDLYEADPLHNVAFSIHMYGYWETETPKDWQYKVQDWLDSLDQTGLAFMIGEFGWDEPTNESVPYNPREVIAKADELNMGWFNWSWFDGKEKMRFNIVKSLCAPPVSDSLTPGGKYIVPYWRKHAEKASIFTK